jgi:hypothetical protein
MGIGWLIKQEEHISVWHFIKWVTKDPTGKGVMNAMYMVS